MWLWLCRGLASGYVAFFWCKLSTHASVIDISVLILSVYFVFYLGEHFFHVSGVLAAVSFGILFSHHAPHGERHRLLATFLAGLRRSHDAPAVLWMIAAMNEDVIHANHIVFAQIAHFAETHIFVLVSPRLSRRLAPAPAPAPAEWSTTEGLP